MADRRLLADLAPLRESRDFRLLYGGQLVSFLGTQLGMVAVPVQVFRLTGSSFMVGLVSLAQLVPLLVGSLLGGAVVDARDRRTLLLWMQVALAVTSAGLALNAAGADRLWPLFVLPAVAAGLSGVDRPARSAVIPNVVGRESLPAAYALWQILLQVGGTVGPGVAGLLLARAGVAAVYWIDAASFLVAFAAVLRMRPLPPQGGGTRVGLGSMLDGFRFLRGRRALTGTFVVDLDAMIFGLPRAVFPELGLRVLHGGPSTVGLLYAAPGAGALVGAVTTGWVSGVRRQGAAVLLSVGVWGGAIALFGLTSSLPLALGLLGIAGWADVISAVFRNTILQLNVPDVLRGRLSAIHIAVVTGGPRLGDLETGTAAALTGSARIAVVSGGLACLAGLAVIAWWLPELRRYTHQPVELDAPPAVMPEPPAGA